MSTPPLDIVDRIRPHRHTNGPVTFRDPNVLREAADEIETLRKRLDELRQGQSSPKDSGAAHD